jgi:hypothetical protein
LEGEADTPAGIAQRKRKQESAINSCDHKSRTREEQNIRSIDASNGIARPRDDQIGAWSPGSAETRRIAKNPNSTAAGFLTSRPPGTRSTTIQTAPCALPRHHTFGVDLSRMTSQQCGRDLCNVSASIDASDCVEPYHVSIHPPKWKTVWCIKKRSHQPPLNLNSALTKLRKPGS